MTHIITAAAPFHVFASDRGWTTPTVPFGQTTKWPAFSLEVTEDTAAALTMRAVRNLTSKACVTPEMVHYLNANVPRRSAADQEARLAVYRVLYPRTRHLGVANADVDSDCEILDL
jgi:hypothetical protein